jgi:hypothetical protein
MSTTPTGSVREHRSDQRGARRLRLIGYQLLDQSRMDPPPTSHDER